MYYFDSDIEAQSLSHLSSLFTQFKLLDEDGTKPLLYSSDRFDGDGGVEVPCTAPFVESLSDHLMVVAVFDVAAEEKAVK